MASRGGTRGAGKHPAPHAPVARLMVDVPLPHLDRPFDYLVPATLDEQVRPGSRVRVRFAGRLVDGYVLERRDSSEHGSRLAYVERAVGEPVLTAETTALFRAVADRWAGNFVDVVRLGVPPRHARAEAAAAETPGAAPVPPERTGFGRYRAGTAFLDAVHGARVARAVWSALPGEAWEQRVAELVQVALASGRGAIAVVPDARDLARLDRALAAALGDGRHVLLAADLGPAERYRRWLAVRRGAVRAVAGTRAAAYAPVANLGLVVIWDDGDDLHDEPRAPYAGARDVLVLRSSLTGCAFVAGGYARTAEAQLLLESGWAHEISAERQAVRSRAARVSPIGEDAELARDPAASAARLPSLAWRVARESLAQQRPVLVQVPRRGYVPALACARDRSPARCSVCGGPLAAAARESTPTCRWCGRRAPDWACPACGGTRMRAVLVGAGRTAEELGRAFPAVPVRTSGGERVLADVPGTAALVVATPGAEPHADGDGYGAALLLDGWALLSRPDLRAGEETLRRWMNAAALVRPGGRVVVGAEAAIPAVQALIRWDPAGAAARELAERGELDFPPAARMASLSGPADALGALLAGAQLPEGTAVVGPTPAGEGVERMLARVPRERGADLARALKAAAAARSARKDSPAVRILLDPRELG